MGKAPRGAKKGENAGEDVLAGDFLAPSVPHNDLIKRLKAVTHKLEKYSDDEATIELAQREIVDLSATLGESWLMKHRNKDVRLLVACALADVLRIHAPYPPYEEETCADVIKLFIKIMRDFESPDMHPDHSSYRVHLILLERLDEISVFSIIAELVNHRDELLLLLVSSCYDIVGNMTKYDGWVKVARPMTDILISVMEETENYTIEILDAVLLALTQQSKKENSAGFEMMKEVLHKCENNFQPFVERQLQKIKAGFQTDSELSQGNRLSEAVYEIASIAPKVLNSVLPAYADDLTQGEPDTRICGIKLLGALFSVGNFHKDFRDVFLEFKRRTADKDVNVRRAMVSVMQTLVTDKSELASVFMKDKWSVNGEDREAPMRTLMLDIDERVRKETVDAVIELCAQNGDSVPDSLLHLIGERVKDKKILVRHAALTGLSSLYQAYCAPFDRNGMRERDADAMRGSDTDAVREGVAKKYSWIPSQLLGLYRVDQENRAMVAKCIEDICLSPKASDRSPAQVALDFWCVLDAPGRDSMVTMLKESCLANPSSRSRASRLTDPAILCEPKRRNQFCELFLRLVNMRDQIGGGDLDDPQGGGVDGDVIAKMSGFFADPAKSATLLRKLPDIKASKVWEALESLVLKPQASSEVDKIQADALKKLGPKSSLLEAVKAVIAKLSDKHFGVDFVKNLLQDVLDGANVSEDDLSILPHLAQTNPRLFWDQPKLLESLLIKRAHDPSVAVPLLKTVSTAADCLEALRTRRPVIRRLKDICSNENWKVAKYATRTLIALGGQGCDEMSSVVTWCMDSLKLDDPSLPSVLAALSEAARRASDLLSPVDRDKIIAFVCDSALKQSMAAAGGKKTAAAGRHAACECRVLATKLATSVVLGIDDPSQDEDPESSTALLATLTEPVIALLGSMAADNESAWDPASPKAERAALRGAAGSCLIKLAKVAHLEKSIKPQTFVAVSRLVQDDAEIVKDKTVKDRFIKKLVKGVLKEHGKLPFKFAAIFALAGPREADTCKVYLRHTVSLMRSLQRSKKWISVIPEHVLPWLVFLLANTPDHLDDEEDGTQAVSVSMKKHLELFLGACLQGQEGEHNYLAMLEIFDFIKQCEVKWDSALDGADPSLVRRNVGLCAELGHRLVKKLGESRRWNNEGVTCSISRIVEGCGLFQRIKGGKPVSYASQLPPELALSPIKNKPSPAVSHARPASAGAGRDTPNKQRAKAPAAKKGKAAPKAAKPKKGGRGRKERIDDLASSEDEEDEKEDEEDEEEREESTTSTARRSISATMEEGGTGGSGRSSQDISLSPPSKPAPTLPERKSSRAQAASEVGGRVRADAVAGEKRQASGPAAQPRAKHARGKAGTARDNTPVKVDDGKNNSKRSSTSSAADSKRSSTSNKSALSDFDFEEEAQDSAPASPPTAPRGRSSEARRAQKAHSPSDKGKENDSPPEKKRAGAAGAGVKRARDSASHFGGAGKGKVETRAEVPKRARDSASHFARLSTLGESSSQSQATTEMWGQALKNIKPMAAVADKPKKKRRL